MMTTRKLAAALIGTMLLTVTHASSGTQKTGVLLKTHTIKGIVYFYKDMPKIPGKSVNRPGRKAYKKYYNPASKKFHSGPTVHLHVKGWVGSTKVLPLTPDDRIWDIKEKSNVLIYDRQDGKFNEETEHPEPFFIPKNSGWERVDDLKKGTYYKNETKKIWQYYRPMEVWTNNEVLLWLWGLKHHTNLKQSVSKKYMLLYKTHKWSGKTLATKSRKDLKRAGFKDKDWLLQMIRDTGTPQSLEKVPVPDVCC